MQKFSSAFKKVSYILIFSLSIFLLASCGKNNESASTKTTANTPSLEEMVNGVINQAKSETTGAKIFAELNVDSNDKTVQAIVKDGIKLDMNIVADNKSQKAAFDLVLNLAGADYKVAYLGDEKQSFLKWGEQWFGPGQGNKAIIEAEPKTNDNITEAEIKELINVFNGNVVDDGDSWTFTGSCDAKKLQEYSQSQPDVEKMSAKDFKIVDKLCQKVTIKFSTNKNNGSFKSFEIKLDLNKEEILSIAELAGESTDIPVENISFEAKVEVTDNVNLPEIKSPDNLKPWKDLSQTVMNDLFPLLMGGQNMS